MKNPGIKRSLDIGCALLGLAVLSPVLAVIALAVWAEDRHSPLFLGARVARGGGRFRMLKFRTMIPDAWKSGVSSTAAGDRRITRVGKWLRRAKLDELPQLWNVLKGEMSLVGPRPQVESEVARYTPEERRMLAERPGVTDVASLVFADEGGILQGCADPDLYYNQVIRPWKSRLSLLYLEERTFFWDLKILAWTVLSGFSRERALERVARMLVAWNADATLLRMARRREPLLAWPPPGAGQVAAAAASRSAHA